MSQEDIKKVATKLLNKFKSADQDDSGLRTFQLLEEGVAFFKATRHAVVTLELAPEDECESCIYLLLDLLVEMICKFGLDFQETSGSLKGFLYGLQTLCNVTTKFTTYRIKLADTVYQSSEMLQLFETSLKHLPMEDANKLVVVQIVLLNNLIMAPLPGKLRFMSSSRNQHVILELIKAYPSMKSETQGLCDGLIKNLADMGFCEAVFAESSSNKGYMSELQYELLGILCHSKSVPEASKFYGLSVDLFSETIEVIDTLTKTIKEAETVSFELDSSSKTAHVQLKVWMEWFYLVSDPEITHSRSELISSRLLQHALRLLQTLEDNVPKVVTLKDNKHFNPSHLTMTTAKTWVMRVINNLIYDNFKLQDEVRELNCLPLILNQCNIDDNNPYLRELGIFAVRNLTSHNPENAALVKALSPKGPAPSPVLDELGLKTTTDSNGVPRIIQKK